MYLVVITQKKWLNTIFVFAISFILLFGIIQLIQLLIPQTEITLEQRVSFLFPSSTRMASIYMTSPNQPAIQTGSLIGKKWKIQKIEQMDISEITFEYPETLRLDEIRNLGPEITVHINYMHNNSKMFGFFQVWNLNQPFKEFLAQSKKYSSMTFKTFKESDIKVQDLEGLMWDYVFINRTEDIVGLEAFLENNGEMYRFSMFVAQDDYRPAYRKLFKHMVQSLRVNGEGTPALSYVGNQSTNDLTD